MIQEIERIVASHFGIETECFRDKKNDKRINADAKHYLWYVLHTIMGYKVDDVAEEYGVTKRNVLYSVAKIRDGIRMQPFYASHCREIQKELKELNLL